MELFRLRPGQLFGNLLLTRSEHKLPITLNSLIHWLPSSCMVTLLVYTTHIMLYAVSVHLSAPPVCWYVFWLCLWGPSTDISHIKHPF